MNNVFFAAAAVVAVSFVAACDAEPIGCDFREGSLNGPEDRCQERRGFQSIGFDGACEASGGEVVKGGCPEDGRVIGCVIGGSGDDVVDFYYEPKTVDEATSDCGSDEVVDVDF